MHIQIVKNYDKRIENEIVEMVERKGIGHPDSLADMIAETFSCRYSQYCLKMFGVVLNHWVDKVVLSGAKSEVSFGKAKVLKPINAYLFGKVTFGAGKDRIDILKIFRESVAEVLANVFGDNGMLKKVNYVVDVNDGVGMDHSKGFYNPARPDDLRKIQDTQMANDTVACSAYAGYSRAEFLAIKLENFINSPRFKDRFPETGCDVKVMVTRINNNFDVTVCVPFIAKMTKNLDFYKKQLKLIEEFIGKAAERFIPSGEITLHVNTKDKADSGYITVFGTALDKGDYGMVGRGNKYNGVININREMNVEAVSGKNPVCHAGKLYNIIAQEIANVIYKKFSIENYINISARNGQPLRNPAYVAVKLSKGTKEETDYIRGIVNNRINNIGSYFNKIINSNPVKDFSSLKTTVIK